jgi:DNA-binding transcriptional ArsR family regulator
LVSSHALARATVTTHMQTLAKAGFVIPKKIKNWVYYKLDRASVDRFIGDPGDVLRRA